MASKNGSGLFKKARRIAAYDAFSVSRSVVDNEVIGQAKGDEKMLAFDIPDEV